MIGSLTAMAATAVLAACGASSDNGATGAVDGSPPEASTDAGADQSTVTPGTDAGGPDGSIVTMPDGSAPHDASTPPKDASHGTDASQPDAGPPVPLGAGGTWTLAFDDEFDEASLDTSKWADSSSAESDDGHGNPGNQQLEWNQAANCVVGSGVLTMTAKREMVTSPTSGTVYAWTSCLLTTTPSYGFQYGFIEERSALPSPAGFWPAFWTWRTSAENMWIETDVYEFYSNDHTQLYLTQHSQPTGHTTYTPPFDPSAGMHVYGVDLEPTGTSWYVDGAPVFSTAATTNGPTNIITNLAVYATIPPAATTNSATKTVDYVRAWHH